MAEYDTDPQNGLPDLDKMLTGEIDARIIKRLRAYRGHSWPAIATIFTEINLTILPETWEAYAARRHFIGKLRQERDQKLKEQAPQPPIKRLDRLRTMWGPANFAYMLIEEE